MGGDTIAGVSKTTSILSAAAGSALTAGAFAFPWTPKPPPAPTFPINANVVVYTEDSTQGTASYYVQGWGRFELATGKELPAGPMPWVPWDGMAAPRFTLRTTAPLPSPETIKSEVLVIEPLEGTTAGGEFVIRDGVWVEKPAGQ
jgi:hypothetical protein